MSYDYDSLVSTAHSSNPDVFHPNIYNFKHSLGYDCKGKKNLCILDATHIGYIAGNYFISLNIKTNEKLYIRSMSGQGMSCLAMNLTHQNLAIGETGDMPNINIFNHTGGKDFKLVKQLHSGAIKTYRCMNFNLEGNLLASVGGNPDYMLTIWNWKEEIIMLRSKAFSQDVYRVSFSSELDGQLTTSGISHIKFWKMASTFTGLKLQGEVGRFGKTEISDIDGYIELPDGKVLSGSEWGNMILWDGSLIKVEICRNDNKFCHNGKIMQILMDEGELITIGSDGYIKVWDFEKIDSADVSDGSSFFQMEPMNEMLVNKHAQIMTIEKSIDESSIWYAQDSNGGIWKLDLSFSFTSLAPEKMYSHHTGIVKGCSPSPSTYTVATIGEDGSLRVYDILNGSLIAETFSANKGTSVLWIEENSIFSENCIASGYSDGILRFFTLDIGKIDPNKRLSEHHTMKYALKLIHICKPHTSDIEYIATFSKKSNGKTYMVTSSKDKTIFLFEIAEKKLIPIGFINTESVVTFVDWKNDKILASCKDGRVLKIDDIKFSEIHIKDTFCIDKWCSKTVHTFTSIKSKVEHASLLEKKEKENLEQRKIKKKELQRKRDLGVEIEDEEIQSESESINEWREYIPAEPSSVLFGIWDSNSFDEGYYISMDKYDGGYLYKKSFNAQYNKKNLMNKNVYSGSEPIEIFQATNVSISCFNFVNDFVVFGMSDGSIRIQKNIFQNLYPENLVSYWSLSAHDSISGGITAIKSSFDGRFIVSTGQDGNIFVYEFLQDFEKIENDNLFKVSQESLKLNNVEDIENPKHYSIEEGKQRTHQDKLLNDANKSKQEIIKKINEMRDEFVLIKSKNNELPEMHRLSGNNLEMDPDIRKDLHLEHEDKLTIQKRIMAWESEKCKMLYEKLEKTYKLDLEETLDYLKFFNVDSNVYNYRITKLPDNIIKSRKTKPTLQHRMTMQSKISQQNSLLKLSDKELTEKSETIKEDEETTTKFKGGVKDVIEKSIEAHKRKKEIRQKRKNEWDALFAKKEIINKDNPQDVEAIRLARLNIGNYKLKSAQNYIVPDHLRLNGEKTRNELVDLAKLIYSKKKKFNNYFQLLKNEKKEIIKYHTEKNIEIDNNNVEINKILSKENSSVSDDAYLEKFNHQSEKINKFLTSLIDAFDRKLIKLEIIKNQTDLYIKYAELRFITLYQELNLLKYFEKTENVITEKLENEFEQLKINGTKIVEAESKLDEKKIEIESILEREKINNSAFHSEILKETKFNEYLTKVYKKKIKINKKKDDENSDEDDFEDSEYGSEMSFSLSEESESDENYEYYLDSCPIGCDINTYNNVVNLRKNRVDIEDILSEEKKNKDIISKELDILKKRQNNLTSVLEAIENELEAFQLEKQKSVNELGVVVPLYLDQLQCINDSEDATTILPDDLSSCLIFDINNIEKLQRQIVILENEKFQQKRLQRKSKQKHLQLIRVCKQLSKNIEAVSKEYHKIMIEKLGRKVSLTRLDSVTVNSTIEKLKQEIIDKDKVNDASIDKIKKEIEDHKSVYTECILENTKLLKQFNLLSKLKRKYEFSLEDQQKIIGSEYKTSSNKKEKDEYGRLMQLVKLQVDEMNRLKEEILVLSQKGGHVLPPVNSKMPIKPNNSRIYTDEASFQRMDTEIQ